ncbi:MAG: efflux RND transporter periplasmic adaptor subunit [Paludibacterium sp.]|uniref:efflux RND transporter periplasmic adaptor subunit n=1 Tax=Paludibacterium sp. TaxID=1917523 RepID=UPI0025F10551|nr:efflux RND transporter periplasmic adaptor subunit [Paludibacterium sp.]MBV8046787.1 efflux RND transporter periplasmic adaptor subunit [Paludibacterium sp.]MBV8648946.1 efflux RND transporter periplasmic adaptor subunit [Paludibacterium sp.]
MTKRMLIMLGGVLLLIVLLGFGFFLHIRSLMAAAPKPGAQTVTSIVAEPQEWQLQLNSVGTLSAVRGVDLSSEIAGMVRTVAFKSGQDVKAGEVLVELNADADIAQLHALQASAELAAITLKRDQAQLAVQGVSQAQVDSDAADLRAKNAQVEQQAALVAKKVIRAPFAGRIGISGINPGQYINAGDKIVTLQEINPIHLDFYIPQSRLARLAVGQQVTLSTDTFPGQSFVGKLSAISPKVDDSTRNVQVEALIDNPQRKLLPGMFANTHVAVGQKLRFLTLPQTAITYNAYGSTVYVVEKSDKTVAGSNKVVRQVFVTTGETRGDQVAVLTGLSAGQEVVTSGQLKLKNGTPVVIDNTVQPTNAAAPTPQEH